MDLWNNGNMFSLNQKGQHAILTLQEMHTKEAMVSMDHDWVFDVSMKGMSPN